MVALGILTGLLIVEICSRLWLKYLATPAQFRKYAHYHMLDAVMYQPHPYKTYSLTPNFRNGNTRINSLGFRNDEFTLEKPEGVYRIALVGGSTTFDTSIEDNLKCFSVQLENLLKNRYGHSNVQIINAGVGGYTTWETLINLAVNVLALNPDLVVVNHAINDVKTRLIDPFTYVSDNSGYRSNWTVPRGKIWEKSCLLSILSRRAYITRQLNINDFTRIQSTLNIHKRKSAELNECLQKNPPLYYRRNLKNMVAITSTM